MKYSRRQVYAEAFAPGHQHARFEQLTVAVKNQHPQLAPEHQQGFSLVAAQVTVGRDVRGGLQAHHHAMTRLLHLMQVVVLATTRVTGSLLGQFVKQCLIEKAGGSHGFNVLVYKPLTA
jgi:hypothetical protein